MLLAGEANYRYMLNEPMQVSISLFSLVGTEIAVISDEWKDAGEHHLQWDLGPLPAGIYFCRLQSGSQYATAKVIIVD